MEEKVSKIKTVNTSRTFNGKDGTVFVVLDLTLEDGAYGELIVKNDGGYKYVPGFEIKYTLEQKEYNGNVQWKIKQAYTGGKGGGGGFKKDSAAINKSIETQVSLKEAVQLCVADKIKVDQIINYAIRFNQYLSEGK